MGIEFSTFTLHSGCCIFFSGLQSDRYSLLVFSGTPTAKWSVNDCSGLDCLDLDSCLSTIDGVNELCLVTLCTLHAKGLEWPSVTSLLLLYLI